MTAITAVVMSGRSGIGLSRCTRVRSRAHSGQRMPTGVDVMQFGQIGRSHEEHETPVSRDGWR